MGVNGIQGPRIGPAPPQQRAMTPQQALGGIRDVRDGDGLTVHQNNRLSKVLHETGVFTRPAYASTVAGRLNGYTFMYAKLNHAWGAKETAVQGVAIAPDGNVYRFEGKSGVGVFKKAGAMDPNAVQLDFSKSGTPFARLTPEQMKLP